MRLKLFKKLAVTIGIVILISMSVIVMILSIVISNYFSNEKYAELIQNCESVAEITLKDMNSSNFKRNIYNIIAVQNKVSNVDTFICDNKGEIIVCGCDKYYNSECSHSFGTINNDILDSASKEYFAVNNFNDLYTDAHFIVGIPIKAADGTKFGYVFSSTSAQSLRNLISEIFKMYVISAIIPIVLMLIIVYAMTYRFTKPLKLMSVAAQAMSRGDFSKRIPVMSDDEIGELSISFNNMTNSLSKLEKMRRSFVANVSHELRTPMTSISGFIDGILDGTIAEDKQEYYLKIISTEVKRLSRVVESMLSLSKLESGEVSLNPVMFNLSDTIVDVVVSREKEIEGKNLTITGLDSLEKTFVYADYDLIYQVVYNLVDNAVKFTDESGEISFSVSTDSKFTKFSVRNTGCGIPQENLGNIFDRFYKLDKSRSTNKNSVGLGLYIVKTIINIHHGTVSVASKEGAFTEFTVNLPLNRVKH